MRPVSLHVEGFGAFREPVDLSFEGLDFFALVGPTGAGKSTVIDAICFALYGSVPRYGDDRVVGKAVSLGKTQARVSLTFDVGDARYHATRVVRLRGGKTSTPEAVLERIGDEAGADAVLAHSASEMRPAVERLLGLPFAHFVKCVVLPQGEFARFLHDEPAKRQDLLARLLDLDVYTRVGQRARELAKQAEHAIALHEHQLGEYAFATDDARNAADARVVALRALLGAVDDALPDDRLRAEVIREAETDADRARRLLADLGGATVPDPMQSLADELEAGRANLGAAEVAARQAEDTVRALDAQIAALPDRGLVVAARDAHDARAAAITALDAAARNATEATDALTRTTTAVADVEAQFVDAQAAHEALRAAHAAHALTAALVAGQPCPVCEQTVARPPGVRALATLDEAETRVRDMRALVESARKAERNVTRAHAQSVAASDTAQAHLAALDAQIADHADSAALDDALAAVDGAAVALAAARTADTAARRAEQDTRKALAELEQRVGGLRAEFHRRRDALVELRPPAVGTDLFADWVALAAWAAAQSPTMQRALDDACTRAAQLTVERADAARALDARAAELGVRARTHEIPAVREAVMEAGLESRAALDRIVDAIDRAAKLREQIVAAREDFEVARLLAQQLRADRFEKWLVGEALDRLVAGASITLRALSGDNYSLVCDDGGEFCVVDHRNADEARSVRTLSGGETFQASLALALALSDQLSALAAGGGAKLDAIFLDEGFGTLDVETLDSVATTIEALGATGRMVGVVTHVPALAERVPVRFRVTSGDRGARVAREES